MDLPFIAVEPTSTDHSEITMANTRERRIINPTIRFRNDLDPNDSVRTPSPPPTYDAARKLSVAKSTHTALKSQ